MKTNTTSTHQTELELWFAELGLTVTEVERCPEPTCEVCRHADVVAVQDQALAA